ncbi:MAG: hypothetical protein HY854_14025 [Burkholderiales bacterium]|nr:hypothetical protein [Burkholderiales bacterium]
MAPDAWFLGPLATADGTIRAEIVDAHLGFDAQVTVPIRYGQVDFDDATVEHVGPDSRMGVSRMGLYVDAPNGRSYLYQFPSTPVAGVEFEHRGALLGTLVSDRGKIQLQAFGEWLLAQLDGGQGLGVTEQARQLLQRTSLQGDLQLGEGKVVLPGVQAERVGRQAVRIHSEAVGSGFTIELPSLVLRNVVLDAGGRQLVCHEVKGALVLKLTVDGGQVHAAIDLDQLKVSGMRLQR